MEQPGRAATRAALLTAQGRALVDRLTPHDPHRALEILTSLRADPAWADQADVVSAAMTQARLRTRARVRFPGPDRWWTEDGLEQATRPAVADRHAARYRAAGIRRVIDLGCGAGSDALAMAAAGLAVTAVDRDPDALWALAATAGDRGLPVRTVLGDITEHADPAAWLSGGGSGQHGAWGCFVDPARRRAGARVLAPQSWSPPWSWVCRLAEEVPATGAKVAPGIAHEAIPEGAQAEWVSQGGDLVEAGVWWGPLRWGSVSRRATVLPTGGAVEPAGPGVADSSGGSAARPSLDDDAARILEAGASLDDGAGIPPPATGPVGSWMVEPDPAVIRAGLVSVLSERLGGWLLDPRIAYIVLDDDPGTSPLHARFQVLEEAPFARKALRGWLRARGFADVVIKKRGVAIVPEQLRAALRLGGEGPTATLVLTRTDAGPLALLVTPR